MSKKFTSLLILFAIITLQSNIHGIENLEQIKQKVTKSPYWYTIKATGAGALRSSEVLINLTNYIRENYYKLSSQPYTKYSLENTIKNLINDENLTECKKVLLHPSLVIGFISPILILLDLFCIMDNGCKLAFVLNASNFAHTAYQIQNHKDN